MTRMTWSDLGELFDGPHATPTRQSHGPYFLNISSLQGGRLDLSRSDHVSAEDFGKWTKRVTPRAGDLLFSYETRLGEAALMPEGVEACLGRRMALLRPHADVVDSRFLLYYYLSPAFQRTIAKHMIHGATVPRILLSQMPSWPVEIPDLREQQAIAEVLGALDHKIAANTELVQTTNDLAAALTRSALTGAKQKLSDIAALTMGSSPPGSSYNESGEGTVFYQGVRDFGVRFPSNRVWTTEPVRTAAPADTLVSVRAPVGRTNLASEVTCIGRGLAAVRSTTGHPMTLFHLLRDTPGAWAPYEAEGTVFGSINKQQLAGLLVGKVDPDQADRLEGQLGGLEARIASALAESEQLAKTRDALLPPLMSGRLKVKDAESVVEGVV